MKAVNTWRSIEVVPTGLDTTSEDSWEPVSPDHIYPVNEALILIRWPFISKILTYAVENCKYAKIQENEHDSETSMP